MTNIKFNFKNPGITKGFQAFQILRFAAVFSAGILLSKGKVSIADIGSYESLIFISGAFSFFWVTGILNSLLSTYSLDFNAGKKGIFYNTTVLLIALNTLLVLILMVLKNAIIGLLPAGSEQIFPLLLVYMFFNNPGYLIEHIFLLKQKTKQLWIFGSAQLLYYLVLFSIPFFTAFDIFFCLYGLILLAFLKVLYLIFLIKKECEFSFNKSMIYEQLSFASPLIISFLLAGSAEYIDGLLVSTHFGSDQFAIFRYGARELPLAVLLSSSLSAAFIPRLSTPSNLSLELNALKKESLKLMHLLFPITIALVFFSSYLYPLIFRPEFISSAAIFNTYLLLLISRVAFPQTIILAHGRNKTILKIALIELFVNFTFSYLFMLQFGLIGIALGTLVAFFTEKLILMFYVKKLYRITISQYLSTKTWSFYSLLLLVAYYISFRL